MFSGVSKLVTGVDSSDKLYISSATQTVNNDNTVTVTPRNLITDDFSTGDWLVRSAHKERFSFK